MLARLGLALAVLAPLTQPAYALDPGVGICIWGIPDYQEDINFRYRRCWEDAKLDGGKGGCTPWDVTKVSASTVATATARRSIKTRKLYGDWTPETVAKDPSYQRATWWFQVEFDVGNGKRTQTYRIPAQWAEHPNASCHRPEDTYQFLLKNGELDLFNGCPKGFDNCWK